MSTESLVRGGITLFCERGNLFPYEAGKVAVARVCARARACRGVGEDGGHMSAA